LLARGHVISSPEQLEGLLDRGAWVDSVEAQANPSPEVQIARARPEDLPRLWQEAGGRLQRLLRAGVEPQFKDALERAAAPVLALVKRDPDQAILQIVRPEEASAGEYTTRHAVHAAVAGQLSAQRLGWGQTTAESLFRAALTMNLSVKELQNRLATQVTPLTSLQRQAIHEHPHRSAELLQDAGVTDVDWLAAVRHHHERADGGGYPQGLSESHQLAELLRMADSYTAKFSARANRAAVAPDQAARQFFQANSGNAMAAALIKEFGIYPPGSTVKLKSGEQGVVVRRGASANAPVVAVLTSRSGEPLITPGRRDTSDAQFAVAAVVPAQALKVRVKLEELVRACA
jgi:HD-GYP domain-containing protein (c-di-GMP phosphodiesterase class II)